MSVCERIERVAESVEEWERAVSGAKSLSENVGARREEAALYKDLAILRRDVPLDEKLSDLEWKGAGRDELSAFLAEIGAERELGRVTRFRD